LKTSVNAGAGTGTITLGDANTGTSTTSWLFQGGGTPSNNIVISILGTGTPTIGTFSAGTGTVSTGTITLNRPTTFSDGTNDRTSFYGKISGNVGTITITGTSANKRITLGNDFNDFLGDVSVTTGAILQSDMDNALPTTTKMILNGTGIYRLNNGGVHTIDSLEGPGTSVVNIITANAATLSLGNNNGDGNFAGTISNGGAILTVAKNGTGTQIFTGANTYTGVTTVNGGALSLGDGNAPGNIIPVANLITNNATLTYNTPSNITHSGVISGTGTFTKLGTGNLTLSGQSTYTGGTTVNAGTLTLAGGGNATTSTIKGLLTINNGATVSARAVDWDLGWSNSATQAVKPIVIDNGTLNFTGAVNGGFNSDVTMTNGSITGTAPDIYIPAGSHTITVNPGTSTISSGWRNRCPAGLILDVADGGTLNISGLLSDPSPVPIIKNGEGLTTITAAVANTFTGTTTVNAGTLKLSGAGVTVIPGSVVNNATLTIGNTSTSLANREPIANGVVSGAGNFVFNSAPNSIGTSDGGWVTFNSSNTFIGTGPISIISGVMSRDNTSADNINSTSDVTISPNAVFAAGRGGNSTIGGLNGTGSACACWIGGSTGSITFGNGNKSGTFDGVLSGSGGTPDGILTGGILNVIKVGTGTQIINGVGTYSGTTSINGGLLGGTGTLGTGATTVGSSGTIFGGAGTGNAGTITVGSLTFSSSTSALNVYSSAVSISKVVSNGACAMGAGRVNIMDATPAGNFTVIQCGAAPTGTPTYVGTNNSNQLVTLYQSGNNYILGQGGPLNFVGAAPSGAYSLRKLRSAYAGNAIQVRRSNDNATSNIGFTANGSLDTTALTTFVGANSAYVSIWYDQSGNGRNATQATAANQPQIVDAGTLVSSSVTGIPSLKFSGSQWLDTGTSLQTMTNAGSDGSVFMIYSSTSSQNATFGVYGAADRWASHMNWSDNVLYFDPGNAAGARVSINGLANNNIWTRYSLIRSGTNSIIRWGGAQQAANITASGRSATDLSFYIGGGNNSAIVSATGSMSEFIIFPSGVSGADLTVMESAQASYWRTP